MRNRALRICDNTSKQPEMEYLARVFKATGFPEAGHEDPKQAPKTGEEEQPKTLHIMYVQGHSEKIEKACAPLGGKAVFKPRTTLKQLLVEVKQKVPEEKKKEVVYQVPCKDCRKVYYTSERPREH